MSGVLNGLRVLDLTSGIAGPMVTMLLADHGAEVIKVEQPGGDPFREVLQGKLGYKTWQRGKRSVELDLSESADLEVFKTLAAHADILVESFAPGHTKTLGIDFDTLHALNPRLIYTSITGYGRDLPYSDRPAYDILVAARSGLSWEHRGWEETAIVHQAKGEDVLAGLEMDYSIVQGPPRPGPILTATPAPSIGAFFQALTAVTAALFARDRTGRGQWVETSLFQGAITSGPCAFQRAERWDAPMFNSWIFGSKAPKGHFLASDDRWIHNWVPSPRFVMSASEGDEINSSPELSVQNDPDRFGMSPEESYVISHYYPILAERVRKFTAKEWTDAAAVADVTMQEVRSPEEALADPLLIADGCVREFEDPELGTIRQVGTVLELSANPCEPGGAAPTAGQHNAEIRAEAARLAGEPIAKPDPIAPASIKAPLEGIRVLDLGLAIAGPYGTQLLADLGADVIKTNALWDTYWHSNHVAYTANRNKRSICLNLKQPEAMAILKKLVETADVVQHNMRYEAAVRMGVDYESLKKIKPDLIYCHTRGHDRGPREALPGNDQTGACIAGVQYEDGAIANGGRPLWSLTSFGDTGNGYLSAIGIMNALYHRNRTGEGQFITTAIVNAQLLASSYILGRPDGTGFDRPKLDRMQSYLTALYGLYETTDGWLAVVASNQAEWEALKAGLGDATLDDPKFATPELRVANDAELRKRLEGVIGKRPAEEWLPKLRAAGAAVEFADPEFSRTAMDDPELKRRRWILSFDHPFAGKYDQSGLGFDFSETPAVIKRAPLVVGECTREILEELGYSNDAIEALKTGGAVATWAPGEPPIMIMPGAKPAAAQEEKAEA